MLIVLKILPIILAIKCLINNVLDLIHIKFELFEYSNYTSVFILVYLYLSSYVFNFCKCHRMFLHYLVVNDISYMYDYYIGYNISGINTSIYITLFGTSLFVILYFYLNSKNAKSY